jgi:ATP-binding cassette subfamily A (ABC1) protein 2
MGLNNSVHVFAWFITYFLQFTMIMLIVTCILHFGKILTHSDPWLIFFLLEIYACATICFSFLVSSLYSKAKLAAACAGILYFLSYVPCMYISIREDVAYEIIPWWAKTAASLLSTSAFGIGSKYIAFYENDGAGLQWKNIDKSPLENDEYNCLNCVIMMVIDCFVYLLLAWYIENVNPSYGIPLSWNYPFKVRETNKYN